MFSPKQFVIALTNKKQLKKDIDSLIYNDNKDYFLHLDSSSGDYFPAAGFYAIKLFNSIDEAKFALKYCKQYGPIICQIACQAIALY